MRMRRKEEVQAAYAILWDKVWWNRHMGLGEHDAGKEAARRIADFYGKKFLDPGDDVEWGITQGKMMALAWVLGSEWEGSGDT